MAFRYNGFLELSAGLSWGYQLTGHHGIDFRDLHAAVEYDLRLKAAVDVGYTLAGEFSIETRRGHASDWVRVIVRKKKETEFSAAASFTVTGKISTKNIPNTADEFLIAVLGADAKSALALFGKIRKFSDLKTIENEAGKLLLGRLQALSHKWLGKALDNDTVGDFIGIVNRAVTEYDGLEATVSAQLTKAIHLFEDYLGDDKVGVLKAALEKISGLSSREGLTNLSDAEAWKVINRLVGGNLFKVMHDNEAFAEVTTTATRALGFLNGDFPEILDLVTELKKSFGLDKIFGELRNFASKEKLLSLADEKLQGVVEKLLGVVWAEIDKTKVPELAKKLKTALDQAENFKNIWYTRLVDGANQSFEIQANWAYKRATHNDALIDVEVDLSSAEGRKVFQAAVHGKFAEVFRQENFPLLVVNKGVLSHGLTKTTQTSISAFGWSAKNLVEVMANTENSIQAGPTGEIQVFMTEVSVKERHERKGRDKTTETVESNFLMRFAGEAFLPTSVGSSERDYLIKAVNSMATEYNLQLTDDKTTFEEMAEYLALAEMVGLIPSAASYLKDLKTQFPGGLGKATVRYVVAFDNDGVRDAFTLPTADLVTVARNVTRSLVRAQIVTGRPLTHDLTLAGLLYLDQGMQDLFDREGFTAIDHKRFTLNIPASMGGGKQTLKDTGIFVSGLMMMERKLIARLAKLDGVIDRARCSATPVPEQELEDAARDFVECAADLTGATPGTDRINSFFAVFDAIVHAGSSGKGYRESSMILELQMGTPNPVTKYLMSGSMSQAAAAGAGGGH